jgi:MFS family permease
MNGRLTTMTSLQVAQEVSRGHATRLVAAMTAAFALGQIIGPVVAGLLFDAGYGFSGGLVISGVLLVLSAILLWRAAPGKMN